jgi:MerR family mercuric resistance operon transcriptional regulator
MSMHYTIGQLAKAAALPASTLRYYERLGLLDPDARSDGNYRLYDTAALDRLNFIRRAKDAGFTLEDVTALLHIQDGTRAACDEVRTLIERRLAELADRLRDLRHLRTTLVSLQKTCRDSAEKDHCLVLDRLSDAE